MNRSRSTKVSLYGKDDLRNNIPNISIEDKVRETECMSTYLEKM